jgi:fatty acid desaturase
MRNDVLTREELRPFLQKSDALAGRTLAFNWGLIAACFALVAWRPAWYTVLPAMLLLAGRQLGLAILMHECAHRSFMETKRLNDWVGTWLCGAPVGADLQGYRSYHMVHHVKTGTGEDPDLANYANYPVSRASLARKFMRDLIGLSGLKSLLGLMRLYAGQGSRWQRLKTLLWTTRRMLLAQVVLLALCAALGRPLLYLLWPVSWLTVYQLYSRIRNAAEHGGLPGTHTSDLWANTRTTRAAWWARLTVAPNHVNFHFEHHLAPTVPCYRLPALHRWLWQQGAFKRAQYEPGYRQVLLRLLGRPRSPAAA